MFAQILTSERFELRRALDHIGGLLLIIVGAEDIRSTSVYVNFMFVRPIHMIVKR